MKKHWMDALSTGDPGWEFPTSIAHLLEPAYRRSKTRRSRLHWFVDHMPDLLERLEAMGTPKKEMQYLEYELYIADCEADVDVEARRVAKSSVAVAVLESAALWCLMMAANEPVPPGPPPDPRDSEPDWWQLPPEAE